MQKNIRHCDRCNKIISDINVDSQGGLVAEYVHVEIKLMATNDRKDSDQNRTWLFGVDLCNECTKVFTGRSASDLAATQHHRTKDISGSLQTHIIRGSEVKS